MEALNYLNDVFPVVKYQFDIAALPQCPTSRTVGGRIIPKLKQFGLVEPPEGKEKGIVITDKGKKFLEKHF